MIEIEKSSIIREFSKKARAEGYIDAIIKIVETEYGRNGLRELEERIRAIQDEQKLFSLIEPALTSPSLDAFKKVLADI